MSEPSKIQTYKRFRDDEYPAMSHIHRTYHERLRCRGFTPDEIARLKERNQWQQGEHVAPMTVLAEGVLT